MGDILDRIDGYLATTEIMSKSDAQIVVKEMLSSNVEDSDVLVLTICASSIQNNWEEFHEDFEKILSYYGIIEGSSLRKTIIERKKDIIVKKKHTLNLNEKVKNILQKFYKVI